MEMKIKRIEAKTGNLISMLNKNDAEKIGVFSGERLEITSNNKEFITIVDITSDNEIVSEGELGLFEDVFEKFNIKDITSVDVEMASLPKSIKYVREKLDDKKLSEEKIFEIIESVVSHRLTDVETTYFLSGAYINGLDDEESAYLTKAMAETGDVLSFDGDVLDLHCVGGVPGNRTTMLVVPIIASLGYKIPKASSRAITSPAGTADTMELLCDVTLSSDKITEIIENVNGCLVWGGGMNIAPADDYMIKLRHTLSLDPTGVMLASILAKKYAMGSNKVLLDIPIGKTAKFDKSEARKLKKRFLSLSKHLGIDMKVIITDGSQPIGNGIGVSLECRDVLWALTNHKNAPLDLIEKSIEMSKLMLDMVGVKDSKKKVLDSLNSGKAYDKFIEMINAQGRKKKDITSIRVGKYSHKVKSKKEGKLKFVDNKFIAELSKSLGAPDDKFAGIYLRKHLGDEVKENEVLFDIYSDSKKRLDSSKKELGKIHDFFKVS
ncbi:MAG: thymidine phosphorylase [Candidatus Woesearchaeota archaeon]